jgi:hypothetical protein
VQPAHGRSLWHHLQMLYARIRKARIKTDGP